MSTCCSLLWLCIISGVWFMLTELAMSPLRCPGVNSGGGLPLYQVSHSAFYIGSLSFHLVHHLSLVCPLILWTVILLLTGIFFFISSVSLPLTSVAQHCFTCPTSVHCRGVFASFYVFHWHSFGWCSIYTGVSLTLTLLVLCCTVVPLLLLGLFCIISGSHWHSFK